MDQAKSIWQNRVTIIGAVVAAIAVLFFVAFQIIGLLQPMANPYVGIWTFLVLPVILVVGLILIPVGYLRERRTRRRLYPEVKQWPRWPTFDPNNPHHLRGLLVFLMGTGIVVVLIAVSSYEGYHYTDHEYEECQQCQELRHAISPGRCILRDQRTWHLALD